MPMREDFHVAAMWGAREETILECARRADAFFQSLAPIHPTFAQWFHGDHGGGAPRNLKGHPVRPGVSEWAQLLFSHGRIRTYTGPEHEKSGFRLMVWNQKSRPTFVRFRCGGHLSWGGGNECLLDPPKSGPSREELLRVPVLARIVSSMVMAWDPDSAMVSSYEMERLSESGNGEVQVGWMTYLSRRLGTLIPLPAPVQVGPVGEQGWLLTLSPERMSAHNPEHVAFIGRIRELLDRAGLIRPPGMGDR